MHQKEAIIQAIKVLDFKLLSQLLDDDKAYMNVPKPLFIETFQNEIAKYDNLTAYEHVYEGVCGQCHKGGVAYQFVAQNQPSLHLYIEGDNGMVNDLYLCSDLKSSFKTNQETIYFWFYKDDEVDFKPSDHYIQDKLKVDAALNDFYLLTHKQGILITDLVKWRNSHRYIYNNFVNELPFANTRFRAFDKFDQLTHSVDCVLQFYDNQEEAQSALNQYKKLQNNYDKIHWLNTYNSMYEKLSLATKHYNTETQCYHLNIDNDYNIICNGYNSGFELVKLIDGYLEEK